MRTKRAPKISRYTATVERYDSKRSNCTAGLDLDSPAGVRRRVVWPALRSACQIPDVQWARCDGQDTRSSTVEGGIRTLLLVCYSKRHEPNVFVSLNCGLC